MWYGCKKIRFLSVKTTKKGSHFASVQLKSLKICLSNILLCFLFRYTVINYLKTIQQIPWKCRGWHQREDSHCRSCKASKTKRREPFLNLRVHAGTPWAESLRSFLDKSRKRKEPSFFSTYQGEIEVTLYTRKYKCRYVFKIFYYSPNNCW